MRPERDLGEIVVGAQLAALFKLPAQPVEQAAFLAVREQVVEEAEAFAFVGLGFDRLELQVGGLLVQAEPLEHAEQRSERLLAPRDRAERIDLPPRRQRLRPALGALLREREIGERVEVAGVFRGELLEDGERLGDAPRLQFELAGAPLVARRGSPDRCSASFMRCAPPRRRPRRGSILTSSSCAATDFGLSASACRAATERRSVVAVPEPPARHAQPGGSRSSGRASCSSVGEKFLAAPGSVSETAGSCPAAMNVTSGRSPARPSAAAVACARKLSKSFWSASTRSASVLLTRTAFSKANCAPG